MEDSAGSQPQSGSSDAVLHKVFLVSNGEVAIFDFDATLVPKVLSACLETFHLRPKKGRLSHCNYSASVEPSS